MPHAPAEIPLRGLNDDMVLAAVKSVPEMAGVVL